MKAIDRDVVIVGGGFSGLAAAVRLVDSGRRPLLLERRQSLGGRAFSLTDGKTGDTVDNGQHVFMQCCSSVLNFLKTIGAEPVHFEEQFSIPFIDENGSRHTLEAPNWLPPSLGLFVAFLKFGPVTLSDAVGLRRAAASFQSPPSGISVSEWLDRTSQSATMRKAFWHPLCISVMNAAPDVASATELVSVLAEAFSVPGGARMGWSSVGLGNLFPDQARNYIEGRDGEIRTGTAVSEVTQVNDSLHLKLRDESTIATRSLILAVPPPRASGLVLGEQETVDRLTSLKPSPILGINLWFDRQILDTPMIGFLGYTVEWAFSKARIYDGADQAAPGHISLVVSASEHLLGKSDEEIVEIAIADLKKAGLIGEGESHQHALVVHEKQATYIRPYDEAPIPQETGTAGLFLAGDWTDTGLPPTIEGAVRSGNHAADLVNCYLNAKTPRA
jgi:squalene-associated FAD-dependent desaturase